MWRKGDTSEDCPVCGYPTKGQYFGIYEKGNPCGKCGYVDLVAAKERAKAYRESQARIKRNRENPPVFKTVQDWEDAYK